MYLSFYLSILVLGVIVCVFSKGIASTKEPSESNVGERAELNPDGTWSEWTDIKPTDQPSDDIWTRDSNPSDSNGQDLSTGEKVDNDKNIDQGRPQTGSRVGKCHLTDGSLSNGEARPQPNLPCRINRCHNGVLTTEHTGCVVQGKCHRLDEKWDVGCFTYTCDIIHNKTSVYNFYRPEVIYRCEYGGKCYNIGEEWTDDCTTLKCEMRTEGGRTVLESVIINRGCMDSNKVCRKPGEIFPYHCINNFNGGNICDNCTCERENGYLVYSCQIRMNA